MTPSRNTRSYTLRSVPSSPGRSFLIIMHQLFLHLFFLNLTSSGVEIYLQTPLQCLSLFGKLMKCFSLLVDRQIECKCTILKKTYGLINMIHSIKVISGTGKFSQDRKRCLKTTLQCLCLIITQLVTNYSRRFSLTSEEVCKLLKIAYLREHVRQISGGNMCHT